MGVHKFKKRNEFIKYLERSGGNISLAAKAFGISRHMIYEWFDKDPAFRKKCEEVTESCVDDVENAVFEAALKGNMTAAMFILKKKRKEVYGEEAGKEEKGAHEKFKDMSREELLQFIKEKKEKMND